MELIVNGQSRQSNAKTVQNLLEELQLLPSQVAVEHNGIVLFRQDFGSIQLNPKDQIEIIKVVAGG